MWPFRPSIRSILHRIEGKIDAMSTTEDALTQNVAALQADVAAETTVEQSAITLLNGIPGIVSAALAQAGVSATAAAAAVATIDATVKANAAALAAAVTANTPPPAPAPAA
jgi:hypothetical protein